MGSYVWSCTNDDSEASRDTYTPETDKMVCPYFAVAPADTIDHVNNTKSRAL